MSFKLNEHDDIDDIFEEERRQEPEIIVKLHAELEQMKGFAEYNEADSSRINCNGHNFKPSAFMRYTAKQYQYFHGPIEGIFAPSLNPVLKVYHKIKSELQTRSDIVE